MSLTDIQKQFHENADEIIKQQPKERRDRDKKIIKNLRKQMEMSPLGKKLLNWADENDVKIVMDRQTSAGGYYYTEMKFIGVKTVSVSTLAHEIMHAIQDEYGLLSVIGDASIDELKKHKVQNYMTQTHFTEAAAFAIGDFVEKDVLKDIEKELDDFTDKGKNVFVVLAKCYFKYALFGRKRTEIPLEETKKDLQERFVEHFKSGHLMTTYEDRHLKIFAKALGVKNIKVPSRTTQFDMDDLKIPYTKGVNLNNEEEARKIGDVLGEFNFLDGLPANFNKTAEFRKFTTNFLFTDDWLQGKIHSYRYKKALLFKQVKHLQK